MVPLAQERPHLALRLVQIVHRDEGDVHHVDVVELRPLEIAVNARVRGHHHVVLVLAPVVRAFRAEHADDLERDVLQANRLADGIVVLRKEVPPHSRADYADACAGPRLLVREKAAVRNVPVADLLDVRGDALHVPGPVFRAVHHLHGRADLGTHALHEAGELALDRLGVARGHRLALSHAAGDRPMVAPLGEHHHQVVTHGRDLLDHHRLRALADRHREDDGHDADADAETAEEGPHGVASERHQRHAEDHERIHARASFTRRATSSCVFGTPPSATSSRMTCPSRMTTWRRA